MAIIQEGSIVSSVWCVSSFFSKLDNIGENAVPVKSFISYGSPQLDYIRRVSVEVEKFADSLVGELCELSAGYGAVFVANTVMPSLVLWFEMFNETVKEQIIASSIIARSLDMCCSGCCNEIAGDPKSTLNISFVKIVVGDNDTVIYNGVPCKIWGVCYELHKTLGTSLVCGVFPRVEPKTGIILSVSPENPQELLHNPLVDNSPIMQEFDCTCFAFSTRRSIDDFLKATGVMSETMLGRIPAGGGLSGNLLRVEKGGRFTGVPNGDNKVAAS